MNYVVGNWKMNLLRSAAIDLVEKLNALGAASDGEVTVVVCPPYTAIDAVISVANSTHIKVGSQNCHHQSSGAFTGEVSAEMLVDLGCSYVIVGHSERRRDMHETDALIGVKAAAASRAGLRPIICVGEQLEERTAGRTQDIITEQLDGIIASATPEVVASSLIAYEPVWAIGTGLAASPEQAQEVHAWIRQHLATSGVQTHVPLLYGGSVTANNAAELFSCKDIDGALVGGASLKPQEFSTIVKAAHGSGQ